MRHKFLVLGVKKWLKSVHIYGSYCKIKTGVPLFLDHSVPAARYSLVAEHDDDKALSIIETVHVQ